MQFGFANRAIAVLVVSLSLVSQNGFGASALELDPTNQSQIKEVSKKIADHLVPQYAKIENGVANIVSGVPGTLTQPPYYWWLCGAMFNELINYWHYTGDDTYNDLVRDGMIFQMGEHYDLKPANQSKDEGNDDQLFWAFTMMTAAELNFPKPPDDKPDWLTIAQSVFNQLVERWDPECGGGLRWQIASWHSGWDYKNTPSNGGMFQLGARLAAYTGNNTYAEKAEEAYDWMVESNLVTEDYRIHDGLDITKGCGSTDELPWTYNYGILIGGAAYMYNYTNGSAKWAERIDGFLNRTSIFYPSDQGGVMVEVVCELVGKCNADQVSFKGYLARWLGTAAKLAPKFYDRIMPPLQHSAVAAARECGDDGSQCGTKWFEHAPDDPKGVGQHMSALSVVSVNLVAGSKQYYTSKTGGDNKGNPAAGTGAEAPPLPEDYLRRVTTADRVGAAILTILAVGATIGLGVFMVWE